MAAIDTLVNTLPPLGNSLIHGLQRILARRPRPPPSVLLLLNEVKPLCVAIEHAASYIQCRNLSSGMTIPLMKLEPVLACVVGDFEDFKAFTDNYTPQGAWAVDIQDVRRKLRTYVQVLDMTVGLAEFIDATTVDQTRDATQKMDTNIRKVKDMCDEAISRARHAISLPADLDQRKANVIDRASIYRVACSLYRYCFAVESIYTVSNPYRTIPSSASVVDPIPESRPLPRKIKLEDMAQDCRYLIEEQLRKKRSSEPSENYAMYMMGEGTEERLLDYGEKPLMLLRSVQAQRLPVWFEIRRIRTAEGGPFSGLDILGMDD